MPRASAPPPAGGKRARHQREDPVAAWLDHLRVERGLATNTLVAYERDLRVLAAFAGECGLGVLELGPADLADFAGALRARSLFSRNPFPTEPPTYVRLGFYQYRFTDAATRRATGAWWHRHLLGYSRALTAAAAAR